MAANMRKKEELVEIHLTGGKEKNRFKTEVVEERMGRQEVRDKALSGAVMGCHVVIAVSKNDPQNQYMFHMNAASNIPTARDLSCSIITSEFSLYLVAPNSALIEYGVGNIDHFIDKVESIYNVKFDKTFHIIHPGERLYITYKKNGELSFYDDFQAKATTKIDLKYGFIISPEVHKIHEIISILLANRVVGMLGVKKNPVHYNSLMKASTLTEIGEISRKAYLNKPRYRDEVIIHPTYELLQELTRFGDAQEKGPNSFNDVIRKLKAKFPDLLKDVDPKVDAGYKPPGYY
ncbi:hypothetical protein [Legionella quateirensis]|uniref:Uncharacterized protein n=1 Tax=Legionella quateirensis TaxID=45072 RepID=A0A378L2I2_9GAMM|nr:hypothetical protein [Legionella quateirensis]KTD48350.1 hypothetical protein Lqua_1879 [Legionella quateirensis]STY18320.1 Uncharacterised protein [Legionella quateirensis]